jgi:phospholipid/cholesterol/gamma-HCH transport system ATP-binding protein
MIKIRGLRKKLGGKQVLDGVDLDVRAGESVAVVGPSGTGKSVLLKHILGLMDADEGSILVGDEEIVGRRESELNPIRQRFGMLFQGAALFDSLSVGENVALPLREHTTMDETAIQERVRERLEWVGLKDIESMKPASLSGGMKKRVGLARAVAMDPEFILYDEPTTGLDPIMSAIIDDLMRALQRRMGVTSVLVTHDMQSVYKVADRVALLLGGRICYEGTPQDMLSTSDPVVRQFVDRSSEGPIQPV